MSGHSNSLARDICADLDGPTVESQLDREHGGDIQAWAKKALIDPGQIIDFSASINPLGPPASAYKAFQKSYGEVSRYPDPYGKELKEALAKGQGMQPKELLLGNGSTQLIYLLCHALRPRKALIVGPAFSEYSNALKLSSSKVRVISLEATSDFQFSFEKFMRAWVADNDMTVITTPNSITGRLIPKAEIEEIARIAFMRRRLLIVDESFIDFVEMESVKRLVCNNPYLIVLRSLTKYYALPGLRLGYLMAHVRRVQELAAYLEPWSLNAPAQNVAVACLNDTSFRSKTDRWLKQEKRFVSRGLAALKTFHVHESVTNFLLVRIEQGYGDALELRTFLLDKNLLIRCCDSFVGLGARYFRIALRRRKENQLLLNALRGWAA